jgi:uncharacterized membrane protein
MVMHSTSKKVFTLLNILLIIGMADSVFLLYEHFAPSASKFCQFGQSFDCGVVNKSPYANIDGLSYLLTIDYKLPIPYFNISGINAFFDLITANAFLGFLTLLIIFGLNVARYKNRAFLGIAPKQNKKWVIGLLIFGIVYGGGYLFYIQHAILKTYCIFCIVLDITMVVSLIVALKEK